MTRKRVLLAALTAAFVAGSAGVALAQASGGGGGAGGGGAAAGGGGDGGSGGGAGGGNSSVGSGTRNNPSPYYKDERFPHR